MLIVIVILTPAVLIIGSALRLYFKFRGTRLIASPAWYEGKKCAFCGKTFGEINWFDHKPTLMSLGKASREWNEISPLEIPSALASDMPVCFDCHIAKTFRRRYPELVVDRPWRPGKSHRTG